ncbi:hypothetical protein TIFTF001_041166 [Ficus carica]|uniref:GH18 domain-containing protein n=1 Tax=Ficus carica TaxID=3494 RepID=A0AA88CRF6_FICCA|nr:hypothetical protein TIFTF001_041166 [Ficus carica]
MSLVFFPPIPCREVAKYLWNNFLGGQLNSRPLGNAANLLSSWNTWTSIPADKIFLGLPASPATAGSGYIPPNLLISDVLPYIKRSPKYGGVMLWSRYYDKDYSSAIKSDVIALNQALTAS